MPNRKTATRSFSSASPSLRNVSASGVSGMSSVSSRRSDSPYSLISMLQFLADNAGLVLIGLSLFVVGFLAGSLWTEKTMLRESLTAVRTTAAPAASAPAAQAAQPTQPTQTPQEPQPPAPPQVKVDINQIKGLFKEGNIVLGKADAKVLFVEFSDPSCPYCHIAAGKNAELNNQAGPQFKLVKDGGTYVPPVEEMRKLVDQGKAGFVWMYSNGHGSGEMGTKALYCAYEKGKFWEAHDLLMSSSGYDLVNNTVKNDKAKSQELADFLKGAVDSSFMKTCLDSGRYDQRMSQDQNTGKSLGVNGTPGFFVNENNFAGAYSYTEMEPVVQAALK